MKLDPVTSCHSTYELYITVEDESLIYIFNLNLGTWRTISASTRYTDIDVPYPIYPMEIVFLASQKVYVADKLGNLHFGSVEGVENELVFRNLGSLLGQPKSLVLDPKGVLYYIVQKFGVMVRWLPYKGIVRAEENEILYFNKQDTELVQIIFGSMGAVWAVRDNFTSNTMDHCDRILFNYMLHSNTSDVV